MKVVSRNRFTNHIDFLNNEHPYPGQFREFAVERSRALPGVGRVPAIALETTYLPVANLLRPVRFFFEAVFSLRQSTCEARRVVC
jgi:hypothetical protein